MKVTLLTALLLGAALLVQTGCFDIVVDEGTYEYGAVAIEEVWYDPLAYWFVPGFGLDYYDTEYYADEWVEEGYWSEDEVWYEDDYWEYDDWDDEDWYFEEEWYQDDGWLEDEFWDDDWDDDGWDGSP